MVVGSCDNKDSIVKFISYTGSYPNLCSGELTLEIYGERCIFGGYRGSNYPKFWSSGGGLSSDYINVYSGEWDIDVDSLPEKYKCLANEIDTVFNDNVEWGCCGGCI